jgi:hypothetical protein
VVAGIPLLAGGDKRRRTGFKTDKESDRRCDRGGGFWVAGLLGGKGIPCRQIGGGAGVTRCVWPQLAVAAAACKKREGEGANGGGDGFQDAGLDATVETSTVEDAEGPIRCEA